MADMKPVPPTSITIGGLSEEERAAKEKLQAGYEEYCRESDEITKKILGKSDNGMEPDPTTDDENAEMFQSEVGEAMANPQQANNFIESLVEGDHSDVLRPLLKSQKHRMKTLAGLLRVVSEAMKIEYTHELDNGWDHELDLDNEED